MGAKCDLAKLDAGRKFSKKLVNVPLAQRIWVKIEAENLHIIGFKGPFLGNVVFYHRRIAS